MHKSNNKKSELLGIPFGTANAKLRKMLLFHLAQRLELTTCYRCSREIESIDDFSIEHKKAWASSIDPVEAFYDLDNIAFSHISCNVKASIKTNKIYADSKEQKRQGFKRYYSNEENKEKFLAAKRDRYHKNKDI